MRRARTAYQYLLKLSTEEYRQLEYLREIAGLSVAGLLRSLIRSEYHRQIEILEEIKHDDEDERTAA